MKIDVPKQVKGVCKKLKNSGYIAYVVGGAVRDFYVGKTPKDWDVSTNAKPLEVMELFHKIIPTGIDYGTITVIEDGMAIEITTFRGDGIYSDGRRPDGITFVDSIEEDLSRRDLRMNAMAFDPITGQLVDPFFGAVDISNGEINTVGDADERFNEDALRMMRAIRFSSQLDFEISRDIFRSITRNREKLLNVSMERIREEFISILKSRNPRKGISLLCDSGLMNYIIPEFMRTKGCEQNRWHSYDVYNHSLNVMETLPPDPLLRLAGLIHDIGKPDTQTPSISKGEFRFPDHARVGAIYAESIMKKLKFSNHEIKKVSHMVNNHMRIANIPSKDFNIKRLIRDLKPEYVEDFIIFHRADMVDCPYKKTLITEFDRDCTRVRNMMTDNLVIDASGLAIDGNDIISLGIPAGPKVGDIIKNLVEVVIDNPELNKKECLIDMVMEVVNDTK